MGSILLIGAGSSSSDSSGLGASPPTITSSATFSMAENTTAVGTVTATGGQTPYTFSISGGADSALFTINSSTGALAFLIAPDYETPGDVGANNVYNLTVEVASSTGPSATQNIAVTVTDAFEYVADYEYQEIGPADFAGKVTLSLNLYSLGGNVTHEVDASAGNLSAAAMETEVESLVGVGNAEVSIFNGDFVVKFIGALAEYDLDTMAIESSTTFVPNDDTGTAPSKTSQRDADAELNAQVVVNLGTGAAGWVLYESAELSGGSVTFSKSLSAAAIDILLVNAGYPSVTVTKDGSTLTIDCDTAFISFATVTISGHTGAAVTPAVAALQNGANPVLPLIQWPLAGVDTTQTGYASGLTLTNNNTVQTGDGDGVYAPAGIGGSCAKFAAATNESFSVADAADLTIGSGSMTRYGWVRLISTGAIRSVFSKDNASTQREEGLYYDNASSRWLYYIFRNGDSAAFSVEASTFGAVPTGTWMFVQTQVNPTTGLIRIRVNKGAWNSTSYGVGQAVKDSTATFYLGGASYGISLEGYMAKWRCSKSIISDVKLDAIYDDEVA